MLDFDWYIDWWPRSNQPPARPTDRLPPLSRRQVCVECVGYLLEELRNPETLEEMRKDVESANIFIGSLIFIQVRWPLACRACLCGYHPIRPSWWY